MYYVPWSPESQALYPVLDELAKDVENIDDLIIARFDVSQNEVAGLDVIAYPTIRFYSKEDKAGIEYSGALAAGDFKVWLHENSSAYKAERGHPAKEAAEIAAKQQEEL